MQIGEFARACQVNERTLRQYEKSGLLQPERSGGGYRRYRPQDVQYVQKIAALHHAGLPIKDLAQLTPCLQDPPQPAQIAPVLRHQLQDLQIHIHQQITQLQTAQSLLTQILASSGKA